MKLMTTLALVGALAFAVPALAEQRPDHFEGKPAETAAQALANLHEYNARLAALVEKKDLTAAELDQVHRLTYTLENALERLREEHARLAELLEEVHLASETNDPETVQRSGRAYLELSQQLIP